MMCRFRNFARRIISLTRRSLPFIWICQEYDEITCRLCAVYGEESYDVFSVENDAARFIDMPSGSISQKRDVQREMEMDAAVNAFFPE